MVNFGNWEIGKVGISEIGNSEIVKLGEWGKFTKRQKCETGEFGNWAMSKLGDGKMKKSRHWIGKLGN
jgi:hypothetical protein